MKLASNISERFRLYLYNPFLFSVGKFMDGLVVLDYISSVTQKRRSCLVGIAGHNRRFFLRIAKCLAIGQVPSA